MDKLRKVVEWIWLHKEQMVLGVMVIVLCWHVYKVVNPEPPEPPAVHPRPRSLEVSELEPEDRELLGLPPPPPPPPEPPRYSDWQSLKTKNPFTVTGAVGDAPPTEDRPDISLLSIMKWRDGSLRAQIRTASTTDWYGEGDQFESYQLLGIDEEAQTVEIYSEKFRKRFTYAVE